MAKKRTTKKAAKRRSTKKSKRKKTATRARKATSKKTTRRTRKSTKKRKISKKDVEILRPEPGEVIVRMYRQGLGDCFLLAFGTNDPDKPKYILIDCGVHKRQYNGRQRLLQVMQHLAQSTGNHLDVVVATHEHADHLSGFVQKGSPFLQDSLTIGELWVAWTEKIGDTDADRLRHEKATARRVIEQAVKEAVAKNNPGFAERVNGLMDFESMDEKDFGDDERQAVVRKINELKSMNENREFSMQSFVSKFIPGQGLGAAKSKKEKPSSNELALGLLSMKAQRVRYFSPGDVATIADDIHSRAYVLGPPKDELFLKKDLPSKVRGGHDHEYKETYLSRSIEMQSLSMAPALNVADESRRADDQKYPFGQKHEANHEIFKQYRSRTNKWRAIESEWLAGAEQLALHLDSDTNNTSLVLAFELGDTGSGDVLLFVGDAQVGNWLSWREQKYTIDGVTMEVENLLGRTLLYKVGHHGSHNSTLKHYVRPKSKQEQMPYGLELMNDIISMIPVDHAAVIRPMPRPWRMPYAPLYKRLRTKSNRRVLRSDQRREPLSRSADKDFVPTTQRWAPVPGKSEVDWRKSKEEFDLLKDTTKGPLYYEIRIRIADST